MKKKFEFRHTENVTEIVEVVTTITADTYEEALVLLMDQVDNNDLYKHVEALVPEEEQARIQEKYEKTAWQCIESERTNTECIENHGETFPVLKRVCTVEDFVNDTGNDINDQYPEYINMFFIYLDNEPEKAETDN